MLDRESILQLLQGVAAGEISVDHGLNQLKRLPLEKIDSGYPDQLRALRRGFPEVVFGMGKTPQQVAELFASLCSTHRVVICTHIGKSQAELAREKVPDSHYDSSSRILFQAPERLENRGRGQIMIVAAGTSDLPIAREAYLTSLLMGNDVTLCYDVGIAGLHRLLAVLPEIEQAEVLVVIAGMEGALPSVIGGLCDRPIVAVPRSIGYGLGRDGEAALMAMLNSCVPGISVVNIDNGFGAGYSASLINRVRVESSSKHEVEYLSLSSYLTHNEAM